MKNIFEKFAALFVATALLVSCSDDTVDVLDEGDYVGVNAELYSGLWGIASLVADVADQAPILEGLRGDLLEPTENAPTDLWNIWKYGDLNGNAVADPAGYYRIIMNVNDYLKHVNDYRKDNPTSLVFEEKYGVTFELYMSTAIRYKVWAYMMLAKIYGEAVYFDDPLAEYQDIKNFPVLDFDQTLDKCLELMTVGMYGVDGQQVTRWAKFLFPSMTGENANIQQFDRYQFTPWILLSELYLWKGNYQLAYNNIVQEIANSGFVSGGECYICCLRGAYSSGWKSALHTYYRWEDIVMASYTPRQGQTNRLEDFASDVHPYSYFIRPTQVAMARFDTTSVACTENAVKAERYRGRGATFKESEAGNLVLNKWITGIELDAATERIIALYRAGGLHLMLCEALAGLARETSDEAMSNAYIEAALVIMNQGIGTYWNTEIGAYRVGSCFDMISNFPVNLYCGTDHTMSSSQYINKGVRGRVAMGNVGTDILSTTMNADSVFVPVYTKEEQIWKLDSLIAEENFFELSGEGHVMFNMYRMMRRNPENRNFFVKWVAAGRPDVEATLADDKGWFIDYELGK